MTTADAATMIGPSDSRKPAPAAYGSIRGDVLYRLDAAAARLGWGDHALRAARRRGLKIYREGRRNYVLGSDILDLITRGRS